MSSVSYREFKKIVEANKLNGHAWMVMFFKEELKELEILSQSERRNRVHVNDRLNGY